jgi:hypothetical protein
MVCSKCFEKVTNKYLSVKFYNTFGILSLSALSTIEYKENLTYSDRGVVGIED